jgi:hypothetical protein
MYKYGSDTVELEADGHTVYAQGVEFAVTQVDPSDLSFSSDSWDSDDAEASYPNPSEMDNPEDLRVNYLLHPTGDEVDNKSAYKLPFRNSHEGAANENAVVAIIQAINGARGGVSGVSQDTLERAFSTAVQMGVAAGIYDSPDDAPDFKAANAQATLSVGLGVEAAADGQLSLTGKIWGAGTHDLYVNGDPTRVHVPESTIPETFESLKSKVNGSEPPAIRTDHADDDAVPVAAEADLLKLGEMRDVERRGASIHLTDSELTNNRAEAAAESGAFDGKGFSIVGNLKFATDGDGSLKQRNDGALVVESTDIMWVDVVKDGAVGGTDLNTVRKAAASLADSIGTSEAAISGLRVAAESADEDMKNLKQYESVEALAEAASDRIEELEDDVDGLEDEVEAKQAKAEAFDKITDVHGIETTHDEPDVAAQKVIDAHTEPLRKEIAELEASLPGSDVDDVDDRADDLKGESPRDLKAHKGEVATQVLASESAKEKRNKAVAASETQGKTGVAGGSSGSDNAEDEEKARSLMTARDHMQARQADEDPVSYVENTYDVDVSAADSAEELKKQAKGDA